MMMMMMMMSMVSITQVVRIARTMISLHESYADRIISLAEESTRTGAPIIRPIWWNAEPGDQPSLTVGDQFLLGDDILVAPVLEKGATGRDIYLPAGLWRDELRNGAVLEGGRWYRAYRVALDELPRFTQVTS